MNCNELDQFLHEFLDQELAADKHSEVANHLASCRRCSVRVAELEQADRQVRALRPASPPADFLQQVRRKIDAESKVTERASVRAGIESPVSFWESFARRFTLPVWIKVPLAAAAALALAFLVFHATRSGPTQIPATYQLTKNDVDRAQESVHARAAKQEISLDKKAPVESSRAQSEAAGALADRTADLVQAVPSATPSPIVGEDLPKSSTSITAALAAVDSSAKANAQSAMGGADVASAPSGAAEREVLGRVDKDSIPKETLARVEAGNATTSPVTVAVAPAVPPVRARTSEPSERGSNLLAKATPPTASSLVASRQSGWLDLATQTFYVEFGKASVGGAFVRGHLDEKGRFIVTSDQVEGQVIELDERAVGSRGAVGWLELSSRNFVPARPGLKPSYPYLEGYQGRQGEFHPTSRKIHRAGE